MKDPFLIIERPLLTEKSMDQSHDGKYTFRVQKTANKIEIADAVERIFKVNVVKVNTMNVKGKKRRVGRFAEGRTTDWKKAIVTVQAGQQITMFEGL
jgi:large subunit ribosomal protein L23